MTKSVKPPFLDRDDGIRQQPPSKFQKQTNGLFCIRVLSENQKEAFRAPFLGKTAEATGVIRTTILESDVRNLKEVALSSPTGAKREPYKYVESFDKAQSDITQFYTVRKQLPTLNPGWVSVISRECGDPEEALGSVSLLLEIGL